MDDKIGILKSGTTHVSGACPIVDWLLSCLVKRLGRSISDVGTATSAIDTISTQIWPDYGNSIYSNGCFSVFQWWARPGLVLIWPTISCLNLFKKTLKWSLVSLYKLSKKTFICWIQYKIRGEELIFFSFLYSPKELLLKPCRRVNCIRCVIFNLQELFSPSRSYYKCRTFYARLLACHILIIKKII